MQVALALIAAAAYGYATWLKSGSSHYSVGAWLIGTPVAVILILGFTYLRLRYLRARKAARTKEPPSN